MAVFDSICRMAVDNSDVADFVVVYVEEAHATDGWAFPGNVDISQHRTLEDRLTAAARLTTSPLPANLTVVADAMSNELALAYGGLPDRFYVVHNGTVAFQGPRGPYEFRPEDVASWLGTYRDTLSV